MTCYQCPKCGTSIITNVQVLQVHCTKCGVDMLQTTQHTPRLMPLFQCEVAQAGATER